MNNRNLWGVFAALILCLLVGAPAMADDHRTITSYWGYHCGPGGAPVCDCVIGPMPPLELVGQRIRECGGTTWSWGLTTCPDPTVDYEDCIDPMVAPEQAAVSPDAACEETAEVVVTSDR